MTAEAFRTADFSTSTQVYNINEVPSFDTGKMGVLEPQSISTNEDFTVIMLDLLPEFTDVLKKFGGVQAVQLSPTDLVSAFFPIVRKALEAKAKSEGRSLTKEEERLLLLSETSVTLSTGVIENLSVNDRPSKIIKDTISIARPIMEANAAIQERKLTKKEELDLNQLEGGLAITIKMMEDMIKDNSTFGIIASNLQLAQFLMESQATYENRRLSWMEENSLRELGDVFYNAVDIMQDFNNLGNNTSDMLPTVMRFTKFLYEARARNESRMVSWKEEEEIRLTEGVLKASLRFIDEMVSASASKNSLINFMTTIRNLFQQDAETKGRSTVDSETENNLKIVESVLNLALATMKQTT